MMIFESNQSKINPNIGCPKMGATLIFFVVFWFFVFVFALGLIDSDE